MEKEIARALLEIKAVFLRPNEPFTWVSGLKAPLYCDNRLTLGYPILRKKIAIGLAELIKKFYPECEAVMGTATAGIPHAALVADFLELPMGYVRGVSKDHGRHNQIEGIVTNKMKVVVIEDLISTGNSSLDCVKALKEAGCEVLGLVAIFTYNLEKAFKNFEQEKVNFKTLTNFDILITSALENSYIKEEDMDKLLMWRNNPQDENWIAI